ncbi:MAG: VOC family protein [Dokdonella sp.]
MTTALSYAIKYVSDMERAVRFHVEQLGLVLRFQSPHWSELETGGTTLALHPASPEHPAGTCQLGFCVADLTRFHEEAASRGVQFTAPPMALHGSRIARFLDSDGAECSVGESR